MIGMNPDFAAQQAVLREKAAAAAAELQAFNDAELAAQRSVLQTDNEDVLVIAKNNSEFLDYWRPRLAALERHVVLGGVVADPLAGRTATLESDVNVIDSDVGRLNANLNQLASQLEDMAGRLALANAKIEQMQAVMTGVRESIPDAPSNLVKTVIAILLAIKAKIPAIWPSNPSTSSTAL